MRICFALLALVLISDAVPAAPAAAPHHKPAREVVLAPGYAELTFTPPEPGSYTLPALGKAADGRVVTSQGKPSSLHKLSGDKFVVLSFIYTRCDDVNGCPLASTVLRRVQDRIAADEALKEYVRLLSISFDRLNDSPAVLETYANNFRSEGFDWQFLTTPTDKALDEILGDYDQFIIEDVNEAGEKVGTISHILRVYLIDQNRDIRNIYSVSFLHPDIIINDIRTIVHKTSVKKRIKKGME